MNSNVCELLMKCVVTCDSFMLNHYDLGLYVVGLKSFVISSDYQVYMGSSMTVWSQRWLLLYLCSYKLDGSVTVEPTVNPHRWQSGSRIRRRCWWPLHRRLMCPHDRKLYTGLLCLGWRDWWDQESYSHSPAHPTLDHWLNSDTSSSFSFNNQTCTIKEWWFAPHMVEHNLSHILTSRLLSLQ
jgi:hypothetical protein